MLNYLLRTYDLKAAQDMEVFNRLYHFTIIFSLVLLRNIAIIDFSQHFSKRRNLLLCSAQRFDICIFTYQKHHSDGRVICTKGIQ